MERRTATYLKVLHPVNNSSDATCDIDIVFVHGLNPHGFPDHAKTTWTHSSQVCWPETLLPQTVPSSRILLYGYNSNVSTDISSQSVRDHATNLLDRFNSRRQDENQRQRPVIFVCHSLGGLVVKQALVLAQLNSNQYGSIRRSTKGLVFFGTPHNGGNMASIAEPVANVYSLLTGQPRNNLLKMLKKDGLFNEELINDFNPQKDDYDVLTFFETRHTDVTIKIRFTFRLVPQITSMLVVNRTSARYGGAKEGFPLAIDDNHSGICKFSGPDDSKYEPVRDNIKQMANKFRQGRAQPAFNLRNAPSGPDRTPGQPTSNLLPQNSTITNTASQFTNTTESPSTGLTGPAGGVVVIGRNSSQVSLSNMPSFIPKIQTSHFIGREPIFIELDKFFKDSETRKAALWGMGGVGKSQCAVEYCKRRQKLTGCNVLWLNAQSTTSLSDSFRDVARTLSLETKDPVAAVQLWIFKRYKCFVVFDNVLSIDTIENFFPDGEHEVLITTRDRALVGSESIPFGVEVTLLDEVTAMVLYVLNLGSWTSQEQAIIKEETTNIFASTDETQEKQRILSTLKSTYHIEEISQLQKVAVLTERLPLAIVQSASYLREFPMPFPKYLERFHAKVPETRRKFYSHRMTGAKYNDSVMSTWDMTVETLEQKMPNAVKMLTMFGFLVRTQIDMDFIGRVLSDSVFWSGMGHLSLSADVKAFFHFLDPDSPDFWECPGRLHSLSLVTREFGHRILHVHPMIHEYIHLRMSVEDVVQWLTNVTCLLYHRLPPLLYSIKDIEAPIEGDLALHHLDRVKELAGLYLNHMKNLKPECAVFFLEAYLWYRGVEYLDLAEKLASCTEASAQPWIQEMIAAARILDIISTFQAQENSRFDWGKYGMYVEPNGELVSPCYSEALPEERFRMTQAVLSDRLAHKVFSSHRGRDSHAAGGVLKKLPIFSWCYNIRKTSTKSNVDRICFPIFAQYAVTSMNYDILDWAIPLLCSHIENALLGMTWGCSELNNYHNVLLNSMQYLALLDDYPKIVRAIGILQKSNILEPADFKCVNMDTGLANHHRHPEIIKFIGKAAVDRLFFHNLFSSAVFSSKFDEEIWLRSRLDSLEKVGDLEWEDPKYVHCCKMRLADVLSFIGGPKLDEACSIFEEAVADGTKSSTSRENLSALLEIKKKLFRVYQAQGNNASAVSLCEETVAYLADADTCQPQHETVNWAEDLYRTWLKESADKGFDELFKTLLPMWHFDSGILTCSIPKDLSSLDRWGSEIFKITTDRVDCFSLVKLRTFCQAISEEFKIEWGRGHERTEAWVENVDYMDNMLGIFGAWYRKSPQKRRLDAMIRAEKSVKALNQDLSRSETDQELIEAGYDAHAIRSAGRHRPHKIEIEVSRMPVFIPLPLGRIVGEMTKILAGCYHRPMCGVWLFQEMEPSRAVLFWTRSNKRGTYSVDVGAGVELKLYRPNHFGHGISLVLSIPSSMSFVTFLYECNSMNEWRDPSDLTRLLEKFSEVGGTVSRSTIA